MEQPSFEEMHAVYVKQLEAANRRILADLLAQLGDQTEKDRAAWSARVDEELRDRFAMTALQGLVQYYDASVTSSQKHAAVAQESYRYADAMIAARREAP